jgi:hypothetical protein
MMHESLAERSSQMTVADQRQVTCLADYSTLEDKEWIGTLIEPVRVMILERIG